ncbi:nuclear transport factor 2 family protein [Nonomuraea sp. NPDC004186]|uniref:nuclear transport factor 2 family protein n=1 Tax=Nonomuraea sp. NPDC049625 TaxID=3155775 RepID=UPI00344424F5
MTSTTPRLTCDQRQEIIDLYARYSHAFDEGRADELAALFTEDGVFEREGAAPVIGRDGLAALVRATAERAPGMRHLVSNILVEASEAGALGQAYALALVVGDTDLRLATFGRYDDEFVPTPEGWRLRVRRFTPFVPAVLANAVLAVTVS